MRLRPAVRLVLTMVLTAGMAAVPATQSAGEVAPGTVDDLFGLVSERAPAFAGVWLEGEHLVVSSTQGSDVNAAADAVTDVFPSLSGRPVRTVAADYAFTSLKTWHDEVTGDLLSVPGAVLTDVDEVRNRIRVEVTDPARAEPDVRRVLASAGVPRAAVDLVKGEPIVEEQLSVGGPYRPLVGGLQIAFSRPDGTFVCTLGALVERAGVEGFLTNAHCSSVNGGTDGTLYDQPLRLFVTRVGRETFDPPTFTGGACPTGHRCRYSDASFATLDGGLTAPARRGFIARPSNNQTSWNGTDVFRVAGQDTALVGFPATKVGRTTGRTTGSIVSTCVNTISADSGITRLCQSRASYASSGGDSGSAVFRVTNAPRANDVLMLGLHWGGSATSKVFSPISNIELGSELGAVNPCESSC